VHNHTGVLVLDDLGHTADGAGDDRLGKRHRLEQHHRQAFEVRRLTKQSNISINATASVRQPVKITRSRMPSARACSLSSASSEPPPTIMNRALGCAAATTGTDASNRSAPSAVRAGRRADDELIPAQSRTLCARGDAGRADGRTRVDAVVNDGDLVGRQTLVMQQLLARVIRHSDTLSTSREATFSAIIHRRSIG
jgi:hypothetical protein